MMVAMMEVRSGARKAGPDAPFSLFIDFQVVIIFGWIFVTCITLTVALSLAEGTV